MRNTMVKFVSRYLYFLRSYKHLQVPCLPLHKVLNVAPLLCQASVQSIHPIVHNPDKNRQYDNITRHMRIACWVIKATNTHSEYTIIFCFSTTTMVARTRPSVNYTYIADLFSAFIPPKQPCRKYFYIFICSSNSVVKKTNLRQKKQWRGVCPTLAPPNLRL